MSPFWFPLGPGWWVLTLLGLFAPPCPRPTYAPRASKKKTGLQSRSVYVQGASSPLGCQAT